MVSVQFPRSFHEAILPSLFANPHVRPTIGLLLCVDEKVLMLHSTKAHQEGMHDWWTLLQEGVEYADGNLLGTMRRSMQEELGYTPPDRCFHEAHKLGDMRNHIPATRKRGEVQTKIIRFVGLRVPEFPICLNKDENCGYRFISSWDELDDAMSQVALYRVHKYEQTCESVLHACECGILHWKIPKGLTCRRT